MVWLASAGSSFLDSKGDLLGMASDSFSREEASGTLTISTLIRCCCSGHASNVEIPLGLRLRVFSLSNNLSLLLLPIAADDDAVTASRKSVRTLDGRPDQVVSILELGALIDQRQVWTTLRQQPWLKFVLFRQFWSEPVYFGFSCRCWMTLCRCRSPSRTSCRGPHQAARDTFAH